MLRWPKGLVSWFMLRGWAYQNVECAMLGAGNVCGSMVALSSREYRVNGFRRYLISSAYGVDHDFHYRSTTLEQLGKVAAAKWGLRFVASPVHFVAGGAAAFMWKLER